MLPSWYRKMEIRVASMFARVLVRKTVNDKGLQFSSMSASAEDDYREVERLQNYGFSSVPGKDADGLAVFLGGSREYPLIIIADHPLKRPTLNEGEAAVYTSFGSLIKLDDKKNIFISAPELLDMKSKTANLDFSQGFTAKAATKYAIDSPKFSVTGSQGELIAILSDFMNAVATMTSDPVSNGSPASFSALQTAVQALKTKLDSFKG